MLVSAACLLIAAIAFEAETSLTYREAREYYTLLGRRDICTELGISQRELRQRGVESSQDLSRRYEKFFDEMTIAERTEALHQIYLAKFQAASEMLSQSQRSRLKQLHKQYQIDRFGIHEALSQTVALTEEQDVGVRELDAKKDADLRTMLWTFQHCVDRELQQVLTPAQRTTWKNMTGADFEFAAAPLLSRSSGGAEAAEFADASDDNMLLSRPDVQAELELVDDQIRGMQKTAADFRRRSKAFEKQLAKIAKTELLDQERLDRLSELLEQQLECLREQLREKRKLQKEHLLPFQRERLAELRWRYRALDDPSATLLRAFPLTAEQAAQLERKQDQLREELAEQLHGFHSRSRQDVLKVLTPSQRAAWSASVGRPIDFALQRASVGILQCLR